MNAFTLTVNGRTHRAEVAPRTHLADFLREDLLLTGTHLGCEHGVCGACTLFVDGRPVRSCLTFAASCDNASVVTIEGYDDDALMLRLREAFGRRHALQCGYCTPGMLATAYDIVRRLPQADEARVREELAGNLCRCTGYAGIVAAILDVLGDAMQSERQAALAPVDRLQPKRGVPRSGPAAPLEAAPAPTIAVALPQAIEGGTVLHRRLALAVDPEEAWRLFQDLPAVVSCLPGAVLDPAASVSPGEVSGAFTLSIGPMRATFRGRALVAYDEGARAGSVRGAGGDAASRSRAEGQLQFKVLPGEGDGSAVDIALTYRLSGPLAQFGRPAIVSDVVDRMLGLFADNLSARLAGRGLVHAGPVSGAAMLIAAFRARLRALFARFR